MEWSVSLKTNSVAYSKKKKIYCLMKMLEEIKNQTNTNITYTQNDITKMKKEFSENLLSIGIEKKANDIIQGFASSTSLFDGLKNNFKESAELIPKENFN